MPGHIYLCFVWHMHQPLYKDLVTGEYKLPWTRLHALKDYYGMVKVLEEFPKVHQTFNLVPSLLLQIEDYVSGKASDSFYRLALKPAESLTQPDKEFILRYFFQANEARLIGRYPRYAQLHRLMQSTQNNPQQAASRFDTQAMRDLQVLSQLAWFDEEYLRQDAEVSRLAGKGRDFSLQDQVLLGRKQQDALGNVIPAYREAAKRGQIELSTTPFYHPILPLLCDSNIAAVAHPYVPLPSQFRYPGDAEEQISRAVDYFAEQFGQEPRGMWPSEGSVSDEVLKIASERGFQWLATDNGVLARTLKEPATPSITYQPYLWEQGGRRMHVLFRDHFLSDLIGFVYSKMDARAAVEHFLHEIRTNCTALLSEGRDAVVPIILDGENAWEHYEESGRPFLRHLYGTISSAPDLSAVTVTEALEAVKPTTLTTVFPGSWIQANFDVWIGADEDNRAWEYLLAARQTYTRVIGSPKASTLSEKARKMAWEEILIAEGSDWCWWYGPEHASANRPEFDQLYRDHLANVYKLLDEPVPTELSRPILSAVPLVVHEHPTSAIKPTIDGMITSYFEWMGAGTYRKDRSGAMHSRESLLKELRYGSDTRYLYVRADFNEPITGDDNIEFRLNFKNQSGEVFHTTHTWRSGRLELSQTDLNANSVRAALGSIYEAEIPFSEIRVKYGETVRVSLSLFRDGLPIAALPPAGDLDIDTREPSVWTF
jgi:alpha-amylase/alpha-mannosidase (GH57 family)